MEKGNIKGGVRRDRHARERGAVKKERSCFTELNKEMDKVVAAFRKELAAAHGAPDHAARRHRGRLLRHADAAQPDRDASAPSRAAGDPALRPHGHDQHRK
jgi:hypothetical protein